MYDLSLKGILRVNKSLPKDVSVAKKLFGSEEVSGTHSVRDALTELARKECRFTTKVICLDNPEPFEDDYQEVETAFEQTWTHFRIRIKLDPDEGITAEQVSEVQRRAEEALDYAWSNRYGASHEGELTCPFTFEIVWVTSGQHYTVRVFDEEEVCPGCDYGEFVWTSRSWGVRIWTVAVAHELGHLLGLADEYESDDCPDRDPVNTGSIMDKGPRADYLLMLSLPDSRMYEHLADLIRCDVVYL